MFGHGPDSHLPPSVTWLALPPVVVGPHWGNATLILARLSAVVPGRIPSSRVRSTSLTSPSSPLILALIGTISSSNQPSFCAFSARWKLSAAYLSISSLLIPKSLLTFSLVQPIGSMQSAASWLWEVTASSNGLSRLSPPIDIASAPMAIPTSILPVVMAFAMSAVALRLEEQKRLIE